MKINRFEKHQNGSRADLNLWFCVGCDAYHVKAGSVLLTFNHVEFSEFVATANDALYGKAINNEYPQLASFLEN
jgi:hypothetical protein